MRIGVIGAGAVGMLIASYLGTTHQVKLFVKRTAQKEAIETKGICRMEQSDITHYTNVEIDLIDSNISELDCCFVCVKQPELIGFSRVIQKLPNKLPLIFVQNGMAHLEIIEKFPQPLFVGIVSHGVKRLTDNEIVQNGNGSIALATFKRDSDVLKTLVTSLHEDDFPFEYTADYVQPMKQKLLVNSVVNPLTALFQVKNGDILSNSSIQKLAKQLCAEAAFVLNMDEGVAWNLVETIVTNTKTNTSSMLQDLLQQRQTEIRAISGYLLDKATTEIPYTSFVYEAIIALERKEPTS